MLTFSKIKFKNILSFGNQWTSIDLSHQSSILIQGHNGSGKSAALLDTLCFVLYGKPFRKINKPNLVNYKNKKDLVVEVWFKNDHGTEFHIVRGLNPQIFEIYQDDLLINQDAAIKDYQEYLEKQILKIDFQAFTQIIILGKATYVAFLRLSLPDRRRFIENILNLNIFSGMNEITKNRMANVKNQLQIIKVQLGLLKQKIELTRKHIQEFEQEVLRQKNEHNRFIDDQIQEFQNQIQELNSEIKEKTQQLLGEQKDLNPFQQKLETCYDLQSKINSKIKDIKKRIKFFLDYDICPTCENQLDHHLKQNQIQQLHQKEQELVVAQQQLFKKTELIIQQVNEIQKEQSFNKNLLQEIQILEQSVQQKCLLINDLSKNRTLHQTDSIHLQEKKEELEQLIQSRELQNDERISLMSQYDCYEFILSMLKDSGIKSSIIKSHIPKIEQIMNHYLKKLNLFVQFKLNENFEETLLGRGIDQLTYNGYSEGEKLRIDLAMMMTWRAISQFQNNLAVNFLVFDEILDNSIDAIGVDDLFEIFKSLKQDQIKVVMISHSDQWNDHFDEVWTVEKELGFSKLKMI